MHRSGTGSVRPSPGLVEALERCEELVGDWPLGEEDPAAGRWTPPTPPRPRFGYVFWWSVRHSQRRPYVDLRLMLGYLLLAAGAVAVGVAIAWLLA